jgi:hypothetical protein
VKYDDLDIMGLIICGFLLVIVGVTSIVLHEERQKSRLDRYRPTDDNRHPHRDEFKAFMRDCK